MNSDNLEDYENESEAEKADEDQYNRDK